MSETSSSVPTLDFDSSTTANSGGSTTGSSGHSMKASCTPATSQYHAQLFSGQRQLQQKQLQKQNDERRSSASSSSISSLQPHSQIGTLTFAPPNLYRTSLRLVSEIDLDAWWSTLVDIFTDSAFHATRVSLSVPQDPNDPWSGPWGLKAAWSKNTATQEQDASEEEHSYFTRHHKIRQERRHRCFERLQILEYEKEPLINNPSVHRVIRRNSIVVLSREYRQRSRKEIMARNWLKDHQFTFSLDDGREMFRRALLEKTEKARRSGATVSTPCLHALEEGNGDSLFNRSEILADSPRVEDEAVDLQRSHDAELESAIMNDYDEYEQQQPSPWSQSPAPSPAMMDPDYNPFFTSAPGIDDDAFNPASPESYDASSIPFPIPASNMHSVIHIPLVQVSDPSDRFYASSEKKKSTPIAILSFLSPIVPYPSSLVTGLNSLTPFIASSFSNASVHARLWQQRRSNSRRRSSVWQPLRQTASSGDIDPAVSDVSDSAMSTPNALASANNGENNAANNDQNNQSKPVRPAFLTGMKSFTRSSIDTIADGIIDADTHGQAHEFDLLDPESCSSVSSHESALSAPATLASKTLYPAIADSHQPLRPIHHHSRNSSMTSRSVLSPSIRAIFEGWEAISPTTGMSISPSIPPEAFREFASNPREAMSLFAGKNHSKSKRPGRKTNARHRHRGRRARSLDDRIRVSGRLKKNGVDRMFVAPKSSLLRLVIDGIPIHVFTCSTVTGQVTWVNNRILQYTGRSLEEHLGPGWLSHMHPDDQTVCRKAWENAFEEGNGFAGEYRLRRFDGAYRFFLWRIVPLRDVKGRIIHWFGTCTDVHDQRIAKESSLRQLEIESSERKYRLLAEAIPQIVFTFTPGTGVTYANEKWESYSGLDFERSKGFGFMSQVHPDDRHKLQLPDLVPHQTAGIIWHSEIRLLSAEEEYRWFLVKCISVDELDTGDVRWFGTCTDINDHKLLEHKLKEAHDAAQKSTESKTRFLSNMSHEIRTPLIGITGMLNFLLDTDLTAEQLDYVHTIQQSAESLLVVINDILDLSKVEAGMMKLEFEPFSLLTMIEDANELLSTLAVQKGLELSYWIDDDVPDIVIGDRVRLRQVLLNLIGNAIKFTTEGEVFTQCRMKEIDVEAKELQLLFEVVDTGTGFDSEGEAVMFKPFSQVDSSSTRKHGGSGLGLVISRQLIELHGGEMKCRSRKGEGSTFYFTAKFGLPEPETRAKPQTPQNETNNPFFRTSLCSVQTDNSSTATPNSQSSRSSLFVPSPLAHSKKHSQATDVPYNMELLQDALMNKAASMRLMPPPVRGKKLQLETNSNEEVKIQQERQLNDGDDNNTAKANEMPTPNSLSLKPPSISLPEVATPHTGVILPPRTPSRGEPLRVLAVSQWQHAGETLMKHLRSILSSISSVSDYQVQMTTEHIDATEILANPKAAPFDYIVINLASEHQILSLTRVICGSVQHQDANVLVVTTPMQRSLIMESAKPYEQAVIPRHCGFVFKPLKRSKLNWYFGLRHDSGSANESSNGAESPNPMSLAPDSSRRRAATQREVFRKMEADVGGKGFRVLLVEDNLVNQKVLTRYLTRVGLEVEVAGDGEEFVKEFLSHPPNYYSLILCDLFMPVKDGFEATREVRGWEAKHLGAGERPVPIVALSANVMSDVAQKCTDSGFSTYISKPVNFATLSDVIRKHLVIQQQQQRND